MPMGTGNGLLKSFFQKESAGGIILMIAALLALVMANTPMQQYYTLFLDTPVEVRIGALHIAKPLLLWINDGLMAIFFFLIGLELKRELVEGELSDRRNIILPGIGALGGMVIPALIYIYFNADDPQSLSGWAIPAATDIAFALGVLSLLGPRVPLTVKIFLTSLAIFDDVGAIIIIAFFYTSHISLTALTVVAAAVPVLYWMNRSGVTSKSIYLFIGVVMWVAMLKSGVHATLSGVLLAMFIPMHTGRSSQHSPLTELEHDLNGVVSFVILPLFAFANAGITLAGMGAEHLIHPVPLGIMLGLFVGKQLGVFLFCWVAIKAGLAKLPQGISWLTLYGTAVLCGIGFTMSLFIGTLAFEETGVDLIFDERLGIILGSLFSGIAGFMILKKSLPSQKEAAKA